MKFLYLLDLFTGPSLLLPAFGGHVLHADALRRLNDTQRRCVSQTSRSAATVPRLLVPTLCHHERRDSLTFSFGLRLDGRLGARQTFEATTVRVQITSRIERLESRDR